MADHKKMAIPVPIFGLPVRDFHNFPLTYAEKIVILETCVFKLKGSLEPDVRKWYEASVKVLDTEILSYN